MERVCAQSSRKIGLGLTLAQAPELRSGPIPIAMEELSVANRNKSRGPALMLNQVCIFRGLQNIITGMLCACRSRKGRATSWPARETD